jgi:eukaryotic-like serine/threonine-protein kinase
MHKILQPRTRTPAPGDSQLRMITRVPDEVLSEQVQRFGVFTLVGAGLWTFGLVMDMVIIPRVFGVLPPHGAWGVHVAAIAVSLLAYAHTRYAKSTAQTKVDAGLWYLLFNAAAVSVMNIASRPPGQMELGGLSWNAIVILISSMMTTTTPRKILFASLAAATMDPLGVWIAHLRGVPVPSVAQTFVMFTPNYACAIVATVPSIVFHRMGKQLQEAQELGSYQLVELLGRGGMGEVWRARHRLLARGAAIKLVRPELLGVGDETEAKMMLKRFEREAQATAALSSPHTIRVFDFGATADGSFYYVMELLSGRDLESLVREFGPVPADRTMYLLRQVCHSLADAHARGLVHRDIKPANIYVCRMGLEYDFVKVLDFGLVKFNSSQSVNQTLMTNTHVTTGTPAFMAPEIILGQSDVDRRADVYSLGCVAYYLLTGQLVFDADTPMKMFLHHVQTPPTPPSQRTELVIPRELDELVMACLEKDPNRRPQSAEQLLRMAYRCHTCETWDNDVARGWWETHLVDLTGPLTVSDAPPESSERPIVLH